MHLCRYGFVLGLSLLASVLLLVFWLRYNRAVWHQADPITKGTRWALVIFYDVQDGDKEKESP